MKFLKNPIFLISILIGVTFAREPRFGRISVIQGDATITKAGEIDWDYCTINMIVEEGDLIKTDENSRLEIQMDNGIIVRVDEETEIVFSELARDRTFEKEVTIINIGEGIIRINIPKSRRYNLYVLIETPTASIVADEKSDVRVNVRRSSSTEVFVFRGRVQLRTEEETIHLRKREWAKVNPYGELEWVRDFDRDFFDDFDLWCEKYEKTYREVVRVEYIPSEIVVGYADLSIYGSWRYIAPYGWVWIPIVEPGWKPYTYGRWLWTISFGWVWIPYEPWGWIPFHYGRWAYVVGYGWVWIPGAVWGPGWVAWAYGPGWVAWVPLDPWDDPIIFFGFGVSFHYGWTCVTYESFLHPKYKYKPPRHGKYKDPGYVPYKTPRLNKKDFKRSIPPTLVTIKEEISTLRENSKSGKTLKKSSTTYHSHRAIKTPSKPPKVHKETKFKENEILRAYEEREEVRSNYKESRRSIKMSKKEQKKDFEYENLFKPARESPSISKRESREGKSYKKESFFKRLLRDIGEGITKIGNHSKSFKTKYGVARKSLKRKTLDGRVHKRDN